MHCARSSPSKFSARNSMIGCTDTYNHSAMRYGPPKADELCLKTTMVQTISSRHSNFPGGTHSDELSGGYCCLVQLLWPKCKVGVLSDIVCRSQPSFVRTSPTGSCVLGFTSRSSSLIPSPHFKSCQITNVQMRLVAQHFSTL